MLYTVDLPLLYHGTDIETKKVILEDGFIASEAKGLWCGRGVYFYDIKAKAFWFANNRCRRKRKEGIECSEAVITASIMGLEKGFIFDLRVASDLEAFESFVKPRLDSLLGRLYINGSASTPEDIINIRSILIAYYADRESKKLVIGNFKQRPQIKHQHHIEFANSLDMVFGIETIYCVKDLSIISIIAD